MKRRIMMAFVVLFCFILVRQPAFLETVTTHNSQLEFSFNQGNVNDLNPNNNWFYQYVTRDNSNDMSQIVQLSMTNNKGWYDGPLQINKEGGFHPNSNKDAVLSWVSTYEDDIMISIKGEASKFDSNNGNGTLVSIYINDELVLGPKAVLTMSQLIPMEMSDISLSYGDEVHFVVASNGSNGSSHYFDYTRWNPIILLETNSDDTLHISSLEYNSEQGNIIDGNPNNNWLYQYKYNISDPLLPSNGYEKNNSKIYNLEAFWNNERYTSLSNLSVRPEDVNSMLWSTAMLTRAWMGHGHNVFIGKSIMQPCYGYDAVKTWVNTYEESKEVQLSGSIKLTDFSLDTTGVEVLIMKNNEILFEEIIHDDSTVTYNITTVFEQSDKVHFLVHQISSLGEGNKNYTNRNRVIWDPSIRILDSVISDNGPQELQDINIPSGSIQDGLFKTNPLDNEKALNNPEMGIHFAYYDNFLQHYGDGIAPSDTLEYFEGMNVLYLRVPWSFVEPSDDQFDWSKIDELINYWTSQNKKVGFRITSQELEEQAAPLWLKYKGAVGHYRGGTFGNTWVPNSNDSVFRNEYRELLEELQAKYGNNPMVEFIEMGALGVWGEGHGGYPLSHFRAFANIFRDVFPNKILLWPDDSGSNIYSDAVATEGFGLYDDSIGYKNKMGNINAANRFWKTNHVRVEMTHYFEGGARPFFMNTPIKLLQSVENMHGSYFLVHGYPDRFWDENKEIVRKINMRLGYRFNIEELSWPYTVTGDKETVFNVRMRNAGVAPNYKGGYVTITVKDGNDNVLAQGTNTTFNTTNLIVKDQQKDKINYSSDEITSVNIPVTIPSQTSIGEYKVYVSIGDEYGNPIYELPYDTDSTDKRYIMGMLNVVESVEEYDVLLADNINNGQISSSSSIAQEGEIISLSATPDPGYMLQTYLVNDESIEGDSFSMPAYDVVVSALFIRRHDYSDEYSNVQGNIEDNDHSNNWLYQYVAYTNTETYIPSVNGIANMSYSNGKWHRNGGTYPNIQEIQMHADNGFDSVRTWVNTYSSEDINKVRIKGTMNKLDNKGDGVKVTIMKDDTIIFGPIIVEDTQVLTYDTLIPILNGEKIHFVVNQNSPLTGAPSSDATTRWFDLIELTSIIEPQYIENED